MILRELYTIHCTCVCVCVCVRLCSPFPWLGGLKGHIVGSPDSASSLVRRQKHPPCCLVSFAVTPTYTAPSHSSQTQSNKRCSQSRLLNNQGRHPWRWAAVPWVLRTPICAVGWPCPACREVWQRDLTALLPCPRTRCHRGIIRADWVAPGRQQHRCSRWTISEDSPTKTGPTKGPC